MWKWYLILLLFKICFLLNHLLKLLFLWYCFWINMSYSKPVKSSYIFFHCSVLSTRSTFILIILTQSGPTRPAPWMKGLHVCWLHVMAMGPLLRRLLGVKPERNTMQRQTEKDDQVLELHWEPTKESNTIS